MRISLLSVFLLMISGFTYWYYSSDASPDAENRTEKVKGVNLEAPRDAVSDSCFVELKALGNQWIAIIPFGFIKNDTSGQVFFNTTRQWWGEKEEGVRSVAQMGKLHQMRIMIKPHVWVQGAGWPGDFLPVNDKAWLQWESSYRAYILHYANIAASVNAEMFCIGTEFRKTVVENPEFWLTLIADIRKIYPGKLTYAANWDNYSSVQFWDKLDYIGIDAYFPLSDKAEPNKEELSDAWYALIPSLEEFSNTWNKQILFTEFGYRSIDMATAGHWQQASPARDNPDLQAVAFSALFETVWKEPWMAGGFVWKWHMEMTPKREARLPMAFSPQKKPAEKIIQQAFGGQ